MDRRERILEDIQDSVFFLLLDELSEYQGKNYQKINKDLQSEPAATIPNEITASCRQTIRKAFQILNRKHRSTKTTAIFKKIVIAVAIMVTLITGALAAFPSFRDSTLNWAMEIMDDRTSFRFRNSYTNADWEFTWLPWDYTCTKDEDGLLVFEDSEENWITIIYSPRDGLGFIIDTENADVTEDLEVRGFPAFFVEKEGTVTLTWNYLETDYLFILIGSDLNKLEICEIAENIYPAQK